MVFVMKIVTMVTMLALIITIMTLEIAALRKLIESLFPIMDTYAIRINLMFLRLAMTYSLLILSAMINTTL